MSADRWESVETALRKIQPEIAPETLEACKARIDPDRHRKVLERTEHSYLGRWQIDQLRRAVEPALKELREISPQAWIMLRMTAQQLGCTLPASPRQPSWFAPPALVDHLEAIVAAAEALGRPPRGPRPRLMLERAVAGQCAAVYFDLKRKPPTTSHPEQRVATVDPYHALLEAVFEGWELDNWEDRAKEAASELHTAILGG
jgi:hypothetical protein